MEDLTCPLVRDSEANLHAKLAPSGPGSGLQQACKKLRDWMTVDRAVLVAFMASIGNLLQGWDNASIAGAMFYIKEEFKLDSMPMIEGCIMAMALFGATIITTLSGMLSDKFGRWMMLLTSAVLSFVSALLVIFWSQHVYMLLSARLIQGFSIGLAVTLVPLYIVETAPSDMRGKLSTFPQLSGSVGMFLSYCMVFWMSMLPKTPSWLVSQGRVDEAKKVLQKLRKKEDVSGEMASLLEGTKVGDTPSMEEYLISTNENMLREKLIGNDEIIKLYGLPEDLHCVAYPLKRTNTEESGIGRPISRGASFYDPLVNIIGSMHGLPEVAHGIFNELEQQGPIEADEENQEETKEHELEQNIDDLYDGEHDYLIQPKPTNINDLVVCRKSGHIGGGWQLAWKMSSGYRPNGQMEGGMERVYLHEGGVPSSENLLDAQIDGNFIQATALVNKSVFHKSGHNIGIHSPNQDYRSTTWKDLLEPGVKRALVVGVGIQVLQQFAGINGILYYTPQILEQAGVGVLLSKFGISSSSVSILMSALTTLLMLPFICIAMWLMDRTGRRRILLVTIPILVVSLVVLVTVNIVNLSAELHALLSTMSVGIYFCIFVMGFGPIPNIFCSEIFPNKVRAICLAICSLIFWICDIIVTYTLPVLLRYIGLAGVFGVYAIVCVLAFIFVCLKVPETKNIPIEVIAEFYALGGSGTQIIQEKQKENSEKL
ncbi:monosaccharide-sensing protein 2-like [Hordeum vulgare subsp. vulgare]|uniref:monosaccharide-sensing protein 2-like n=1 Tax=Hordeum vulgare subsp. vulgare TaxID=112509 RepID=UPI001D1A337F|nr:monosaccharide-sensing protein 2-like [Hordeum vulgare subsp. vulgare]